MAKITPSHDNLIRSTAYLMGGQGSVVAMQAAYFLVAARMLGSAEYGLLVGASALVAVVSTFSSLGSGMVLVRHVSTHRERFPEYWGNAIISTGCVGGLTVLLLAAVGPCVLKTPSHLLFLLLGLSECIFARFAECASQVFQAFQQFRFMAVVNPLSAVLRLLAGVSIWMALGHTTAITWAFVLCCVSFLTALATVTTVTIRLGLPNFRFMSAAGHIKEGLLFSIASSTTTAYNDIDKAMLIRFGFQSASGIYGLAYRIVDISCAPIRSLHGALLPRFFQAGQHGVERAASMAKRLQQKTLCYAIAVACCMYALAPMLTFVVGGSFRESASALRWLCLIPALRSLHLAAGDALTGAGHQNYRTSSQLCVAVLNILLNCFLIPVFGWKGAAFASLVSDGTLAASNWMILMVLNRAQTGIAEVGAPLTVDVPVGR